MELEGGLFESDLPRSAEKLFRYMSFSKLMSLLTRNTLYLSRVDQFLDPLEGWFPRSDLPYLANPKSGVGADEADALKNLNDMRCKAYALCWARHDSESDAHWRLYSHEDECVAVVTTSEKLWRVFDGWTGLGAQASFCLGPVRLVDHLRDGIAREQTEDGRRKSLLRVFTLKNVSFRWEEEVRAIVFPRNGEWPSDEWPSGIEATIDPVQLIDKIIVGPKAKPWFLEVVRACASAHGLGEKVFESELIAFAQPLLAGSR